MSEEKMKDIELKDLSKDVLERQIQASEQLIQQSQNQIIQLQNQIQQQHGIAGLARHILEKFNIPDAKKPEEAKSELEVK